MYLKEFYQNYLCQSKDQQSRLCASLKINFFGILFIFYVFEGLPRCVCAPHACSARGGQTRAMHPMGLELQQL